MKLGIIGSGSIVQMFLPHFKSMEGVEINAMLCTTRSLENAGKIGTEYGISLVTDKKDVFWNADIDTVYIAAPNNLHYVYMMEAVENGKHVMCEKPFGSNVTETRNVFEEADKQGVMVFEAVMTPYYANYARIRQWLPQIGRVRIVQAQQTQYSRRYDAFEAGTVLPAFDPKCSGGSLMDLNHYCLHYVIGLFGKANEYTYTANIERDIDTSGTAILKYDDFHAVCLAAKDCKGSGFTLIQGTKGCIRSDMAPGGLGKVRLELNDGTVEEYDEDEMMIKRTPVHFDRICQAIEAHDTAFYRERMEQTIAVSEAETVLRKSAGIQFPSDVN